MLREWSFTREVFNYILYQRFCSIRSFEQSKYVLSVTHWLLSGMDNLQKYIRPKDIIKCYSIKKTLSLGEPDIKATPIMG
jgi:hypothetical protein